MEQLCFEIHKLQKIALMQLSEAKGIDYQELLRMAIKILISYDFNALEAISKGQLCVVPLKDKEKFDSITSIVDELEELVAEKRKEKYEEED